MESSYIAEKSLSEGENLPESCLFNMLGDDISGEVVISENGTMFCMNDVQKVPDEGHYIEKYQDDEEDEDDEESGDDFSEVELLPRMGYGKSEPKRVIKIEHQKQYSDEDEDDQEDENILDESSLAQTDYLKKEPPKYEPNFTPTAALNLVSALKGSREKEGKQARERGVSWAPDVYDPSSSTEHFDTTNNQRHKSELKAKGLTGKSRQKLGGEGVGGHEESEGEGGGGGCGRGSKVGGNKGTVGGGGKAVVKSKDRKHAKKKHGRSSSKYSNLDE
ncbi:hypothetical protein F511_35026 [Dorcoceras hygrometricum]|uniref:Uncharacterized protein n=1 Tax=Dorcoceras hygrometricum TaxID=472368 RepID=A0A2Z7CZM4_9LAMI|nr:hypothetical protein F511_35026 [Dorcoceras hygrometricum]